MRHQRSFSQECKRHAVEELISGESRPGSFLPHRRETRLAVMILPPDKTSGVCLIRQDLVNTLFSPLASARSRYAIFIKALGDYFQPFALAAFSKYPLCDGRLPVKMIGAGGGVKSALAKFHK